MGTKLKSLACHLGTLPDPRKVKGRRHVLLDILIIAVLAALCGIDDWEGTVDFAKGQEAWLRTFLALPNSIPSHDTFNRVFRLLDPRAFSEVFLSWVGGIREKIPEDVVALDGKTLRASLSKGKPPLHVVSAWSVGNGMVLGQRSVDVKSNEIKAIPELLKVLDLRGCIVTIDAMGCQKVIAEEIVARKADYVLAVKANQERLFEALQANFARLDVEPSAFPHFSTESQEEGHGRKEFRRVTILDGVRQLPEDILFSWPRLETLMRIQSVTQRGDKIEREERFYISSMPMGRAETLASCPRAHWGIENRLHWTLDVAFREDSNRNRVGNVAECGAILRHVVLNLLRRDPNPEKRSIRRRRLKAALAPDYRLVALLGFPTCYKPVVQPRPKTYIAIKDKKFPIHPLLLG
jgi:predicted transposase YbfD/YdcC